MQAGVSPILRECACPCPVSAHVLTRSQGCMDICQSDVSHCGGISELRRIAAYAEIYDIGMAPHCPNGPISFAATLQLGFAVPNFVISEMSWQMHYAQEGYDLMTYLKSADVFDVKDGSIGLLTAPGLGIEINEELVRQIDKENAGYHWR
jgi:galactonate dehydratase